MSIRMKDKYYNGCSAARKLVVDDPILAGCSKYEEKKALLQELQSGKIDHAEYDKRRAALVSSVKRRECPPMCVMELNHGDLVVMHGALLQKYFEVSFVSLELCGVILTLILACRCSRAKTPICPNFPLRHS